MCIYRADLEALWISIVSDTYTDLPMTPIVIKLDDNPVAAEVRSCLISLSDFKNFLYDTHVYMTSVLFYYI